MKARAAAAWRDFEASADFDHLTVGRDAAHRPRREALGAARARKSDARSHRRDRAGQLVAEPACDRRGRQRPAPDRGGLDRHAADQRRRKVGAWRPGGARTCRE